MDNRVALVIFALGTVQAVALLIFIAFGGNATFGDDQTRAQIISSSYAPAAGSP
jgi:hypothetical protein